MRIRSLLIAGLAAVMLTGCAGSEESSENNDRADDAAVTQYTPKTDEVTDPDEGFEITGYLDKAGGSSCYIMIIKNVSDRTVAIDGKADALAANKKTLETAEQMSDNIKALAPGETAMATFYFETSAIDSVRYELTYEEPEYDPIVGSLKQEVKFEAGILKIDVKNESDVTAQDLKLCYLAFDGSGNYIGFGGGSLGDLGAGRSFNDEINMRGTSVYSAEVYLNGYAYKSESEEEEPPEEAKE